MIPRDVGNFSSATRNGEKQHFPPLAFATSFPDAEITNGRENGIERLRRSVREQRSIVYASGLKRGSGRRLTRLPFRIIFNELPESFCKRTPGNSGSGGGKRGQEGDSKAEVRAQNEGNVGGRGGGGKERGASCKEYKQCVLIRAPRPDECTIVAPGGLYTLTQPPRFHLCFR